MAAPLPFIDLGAQRARIGAAMDEAILRVVNHGAYILGPEVAALETELAAFCGASHVISCANGTDALAMVLMAKGIRPGDAVVCPSFTFAATAEVVAWFGATPVFADVVEDSFNLDPASLELAVATARRMNLRPAGVITVDLFGQPADYDAIEPICAREGLWMLCDAAQSFGADVSRPQGRRHRRDHDDELLPGKAARLLRRRRRDLLPTTRSSPRCCARSACTARAPTNTRTCASASTAGSTPSRRRC